MITKEEYFGLKPHTPEQETAAQDLLDRVQTLTAEAEEDGAYHRPRCPNTGTEISGSKGGSGDGGFRLTTATTGAGNSSHKVLPADKPAGAGVDVYDPGDHLDTWLDQYENGDGSNSKLHEHGLWREHPSKTPTWCHLTNRSVGANKQTFYP